MHRAPYADPFAPPDQVVASSFVPAPASPRSDRLLVVVASLFGLVALGAVQALYGPAFPGLMERYDVGVDTVGATVMAHFFGGFASTLAAPLLLSRVGYRPTMVAAGSVATSGMLLAGLAPTWPLLLAGASLGGIGFGLLNVAFNLLVTRVFQDQAAPVLNLLSALFGIGAIAGPAVVGAVGDALAVPFLALAAFAGTATLLATRLPSPAVETPAAGSRTPWLAAIGFALFYALYVSTESGVANWETLHLEPFVGASRAAFLTSLFWVALTVGRFLAIPVAARFRPRTVVLVSAGLSTLGLAATHVQAIAPAAYALTGLLFAPIFPTGLAWIARVFPARSERIVPFALALAALGPVATTGVIGAWADAAGTTVIPTALTLIAAALFVVAAGLAYATRKA